MRAALHFTLRPGRSNLRIQRFRSLTTCLTLLRSFYSRNSWLRNAQGCFVDSVGGTDPFQTKASSVQLPKARKEARRRKVGPERQQIARKKSREGTKEQQIKASREDERIITRDYIVAHLGLPNPDELPPMPGELLQMIEKDTGAVQTDTLRALLHPYLSVQCTKAEKTHNEKFPLRTVFLAKTRIGELVVVHGDGVTERESWYHGFLHLVAQLYRLQYLAHIYKPPPCLNASLPPDPKMAVYEYAARFLSIPSYTSEAITPETRKIFLRRGGIPLFAKYQCTIKFPEQRIVAFGVGKSSYLAEVAASIRFLELTREQRSNDAPSQECIQKAPFLSTSVMTSLRNFCHREGHDVNVSTDRKLRGLDRAQYTAAVKIQGKMGESITTIDKQSAIDCATLTTMVAYSNKNPDLLASFERALREQGGKVLRELPQVEIDMTDDIIDSIETAVKIASNVPEHAPELPLELNVERPPHSFIRFMDSQRRNEELQQAYRNYQISPDTDLKRQAREELPINQYRAQILDTVNANPFTVVVGATGSGKTTQVPQMFLDAASKVGEGAACNVICTQPRRIAATSVARRVAYERAERMGDSVGFMVRGRAVRPRNVGSILFCTTGTLLRQLKSNADHVLNSTSHILLDEVHERDAILDYLLILIKKNWKQRMAENRPVPKVVLMSATMNTDLFCRYFGVREATGEVVPCPSIFVPGRLFPVKSRYLREIKEELQSTFGENPVLLDALLEEKDTKKYLSKELHPSPDTPDLAFEPDASEYDAGDSLTPIGLVAATVVHVAKTTDRGAILVFLPGHVDISATLTLLTRSPLLDVNFQDDSRYKIFVLHSAISAEGQAAAFEPVPEGCRKIILSTNIAETSVTIPDIQYVIDSGKRREIQHNPISRITVLRTTWISKANAKQRAGRAGRVQNGHYYGLYTEERLENFQVAPTSELRRSNLEMICLDVKANNFHDSIGGFLSSAIEPPSAQNIESAISSLRSQGVLTATEKLTPLGQLLSTLPVQPALGKMIVFGIIFRCLDSAIILGALSGLRSLFVKPPNQRSEWKPKHERWLGHSHSEHIAQMRAFKYLRRYEARHGPEATRRHAALNYLSMNAFEEARMVMQEIEAILARSRLVPLSRTYRIQNQDFDDHEDDLDQNSGNIQLIKALALVGFAPNLGIHYNAAYFRTPTADEVMMHSKSILVDRNDNSHFHGAALTFSDLFSVDDGRLYMRDITEVPYGTVVLFGGKIAKAGDTRRSLVLDGWLPVGFQYSQDRYLVMEFRKGLHRILSIIFHEMAAVSLQSRSATESEGGPDIFSLLAPKQEEDADEDEDPESKSAMDKRQRDRFIEVAVSIIDKLGDSARIDLD